MDDVFALSKPQWARLRALLDEALALPMAARATWLENLDAADTALKPRLAALLAHSDPDAPLAQALDSLPRIETADFAPRPGTAGDAAADAAAAGGRVGPYRLLRELGSGGMASVWLAERTDLLQSRQVALKLPHGAWRRAGLAERMQREREILATLEHPHIARLYDAGVAEDGQPWLALELVQGQRIDSHCQAHKLDVPMRLQLLLQAARAVAHAHGRLVVHRDLKPANILVDAAGQVKLLDFGIAKLLDQGLAEQTELTERAGRPLTPHYASPEQIAGEPLGTASDIHALGVLLYELLAGVRPFGKPGATRAAVEQAVLHDDPLPPSQAVQDAALRRTLRGDLDTIVLKALKKAPAERYATVHALIDDIGRFLDRRPVLAQPDRWTYRMRKFIARNRLAVGAGAAVAAALIAGSALALWQARLATLEARRAEQINGFVVSMFEGTDPQAAGSKRSVSAQAILDRAERRLGASALTADAETRAALRLALARSRLGLAEHERAIALADTALADPALPPTHATRSHLLLVKATALKDRQRVDEAERTLAQLGPPERLADREPELAAQAELLHGMVAHQRGRWQQAADIATRVLARAALRGQDSAASALRAQAHGLAAQSASMLRDKAAAQRHAQATWDERRQLHADDAQHPELIFSAQLLGAALVDGGHMQRAQPLLQQSLDATRAVFGPDSGRIVEYAARLAIVEAELGRFGRALELLEESERVAVASAAPASMMRSGQLRTLARAQMRQRDFAGALPRLQQALAIVEQLDAAPVARVVRADATFAAAHVSMPPGDAEAVLARVVAEQDATEARYRTHLPPHYRGVLLRLNGRAAEAVAALQAAEPLARANTRRVETAEALVDLALAQLDAGRPDAAAAPLADAGRLFEELKVEPIPATADAALARARIALAAGRPADAVAAAREAAAFWQRHAPHGRDAAVASHWLAQALRAAGDSVQAQRLQGASQAVLRTSRFAADRALAAR